MMFLTRSFLCFRRRIRQSNQILGRIILRGMTTKPDSFNNPSLIGLTRFPVRFDKGNRKNLIGSPIGAGNKLKPHISPPFPVWNNNIFGF